jgi:hypothetical protein
MAVQVKGKYRDLWAFLSQPLQRRRRIRRASSGSLPPDSLLRLTTALHPQRLEMRIADMRQETPFARTFKLVPAAADAGGRLQRLPPFRAGQYLSLEFVVQGTRVSRPYSICCSPTEARQGNFYELTVRQGNEGFVAPYIWEQWRPGTGTIRLRAAAGSPRTGVSGRRLRHHPLPLHLAGAAFRSPGDLLHDPVRSGGLSAVHLPAGAGSPGCRASRSFSGLPRGGGTGAGMERPEGLTYRRTYSRVDRQWVRQDILRLWSARSVPLSAAGACVL